LDNVTGGLRNSAGSQTCANKSVHWRVLPTLTQRCFVETINTDWWHFLVAFRDWKLL